MLARLARRLPTLLMLLTIWGSTLFVWDSLGVWATHNQHAQARGMADAQLPGVRAWLNEIAKPLALFAQDPKLQMGLAMEGGISSLPAQRMMYAYSYTNHASAMWLVDLSRNAQEHTAGTPPLPAEVLTRLASLGDGPSLLVAMGQRNGQVLVAQRVPAPLPARVFAVVTLRGGDTASLEQPETLPANQSLWLAMPHSSGWALWPGHGGRFILSDALNKAMDSGQDIINDGDMSTVVEPVGGWGGVAATVRGPLPPVPLGLAPYVLVLLWAIVMNILILWDDLAPVRARAAPVLEPLRPLINRLKTKAYGTWRDAHGEKPLLNGPGQFISNDFMPLSARLGNILGGGHRGIAKAVGGSGGEKTATGRTAAATGGKDGKRPAHPMMDTAPMTEIPLPPETAAEADPDFVEMVKQCIAEQRIKLLYQPVYRVSDDMPVMHEVFVRLETPAGAILTPDRFMGIAAANGMTLALDLAALRHVLNEHFISNSVPMTPLALNISSHSLDGLAYLQEMLSQGPRVLQKLAFEVRSQEMILDPKAMKLLKDLQRHGGNLAVDYFGGGEAMLEASKALAFNYVKLDCNQFFSSTAGKKQLIKLCQFAHKIGLPIILEKVGSPALEVFARKVGAQFIQGYALGRPQPTLSMAPLSPRMGGLAALVNPAS